MSQSSSPCLSPAGPAPGGSLAIFCHVVDNFGDIGICWRLARQLAGEHGLAVRLWVDDLHAFRRICPGIDPAADRQRAEGVEVLAWRGQDGQFAVADIDDVVIEFFGCELPPAYVEAMALRTPRPVWLNYEGLTAEEWVEGCHRLPSMHPRLPLIKHFFFPGFTARTGGLLREAGLLEARTRFQADPSARAAFLASLGLDAAAQARLLVSLFCYPDAPVAGLFDAWARGGRPLTCLVPEGVAAPAVSAFLGAPAVPGAVARRGDLEVRVLPFVAQPDYDRLLWACDLNVVRGEDSFVRAQWAGRPFLWHIYPQEENLHHKKLRAFLARYAGGLPALEAFWLRFNGAVGEPDGDWLPDWQAWQAELPSAQARAAAWEAEACGLGDAAANLVAFVRHLQGGGNMTPCTK